MSCRGLFFVGVRSLYIRSLFSKKKKKSRGMYFELRLCPRAVPKDDGDRDRCDKVFDDTGESR